jgi:hypothetical protein
VWTEHQVAAGVGALTDDVAAAAADRGWSLADLPEDPGAGVPALLFALLGGVDA